MKQVVWWNHNNLPATGSASPCFSALYTTNTSEQHPYIILFKIFYPLSVLFSMCCIIRNRWSIKLYVGGTHVRTSVKMAIIQLLSLLAEWTDNSHFVRNNHCFSVSLTSMVYNTRATGIAWSFICWLELYTLFMYEQL